jgi:hypothetical protein
MEFLSESQREEEIDALLSEQKEEEKVVVPPPPKPRFISVAAALGFINGKGFSLSEFKTRLGPNYKDSPEYISAKNFYYEELDKAKLEMNEYVAQYGKQAVLDYKEARKALRPSAPPAKKVKMGGAETIEDILSEAQYKGAGSHSRAAMEYALSMQESADEFSAKTKAHTRAFLESCHNFPSK